MKLFTTLHGSLLYGTNTPTSDRDIKHIILPDLDDLLLGKKLEAKVKKTNKLQNTRNSADDVDEEFIPIQTLARHFVEGQTYAIELAFAIDGDHAEQKVFNPFYSLAEPTATPLFVEFIHELRTQFLTSNIKAMMGYVVNQASLYSFKGERLNATRELESIIMELEVKNLTDSDKITIGESYAGNSQFMFNVTELTYKYPKYFRKDVYDIGGGAMKPCFIILEKTLPFTNSVAQTLKVLHALRSKYGSRSDAATANNVDWKATMHALRIVDEGLQLLSTKKLSFPFAPDYVDRLLSIKRGEVSIDLIKDELATKLDQLKDLEKSTTLPTCNAEFLKEFDSWMVKKLHSFYGV